jgi:glycosyltransferase involved in cell wall biosynthesis
VAGTRILGISLVRDEDRFVERVIRNVFGFCDELILVDHRSRDRTPEILERLATESPVPTSVHRLNDPRRSHALIAGYAGANVWVFGVDGDELYDPEGLRRLRPRLLEGEFDDWWLIRSNALHVVELDEGTLTARGYMAPPAPSMVKLHNFSLIESWDGIHPQRLHGTEGLRFKPGREARKLELGKQYSWDDSPLRCLHVCFLRRSSRDRREGARPNIGDRTAPARLPRRAWRRVRGGAPRWKLEHYREGPLHVVSTEPFLPVTSSPS